MNHFEIKEVAGGFLLAGETWDWREILRRIGGKWDAARKAWRFDGEALPDAARAIVEGRYEPEVVAVKSGGVWKLSGDTRPYREILRGAGARWHKKSKTWRFAGERLPDALQALVSGDAAPPSPTSPTAPPSPSPRPRQATSRSPAERFRELADAMRKTISEKLDPAIGRLNPTTRRNGIAAGMRQEGRDLLVLRDKLRALADAWDHGAVPESLKGINAKVQIACLLKYRELPREDGWAKEDYKRLARAGIDTPAKFLVARTALLAMGDPGVGEPTPEDEIRDAVRRLPMLKIPGYFPTPPQVIRRMLQLAGIEPYHFVMEPSAGAGHLADAIRDFCPDAMLAVAEINPVLTFILNSKGHEHVAWDFLKDVAVADFGYLDRVVMNPPFEHLQDIEHVRHAYDLLAEGGRLVSVMGEGVFFRRDKKAVAFRGWLDELGGWDERLPPDSFKNSDRPTGVAARLVVIDKG